MAHDEFCKHGRCSKAVYSMGFCKSHFFRNYYKLRGTKIECSMLLELLELSKLIGTPITKLHLFLDLPQALIYSHSVASRASILPEQREIILKKLNEERKKEYDRLHSLLFF